MLRGSCPVLRGPGGEIPPGYSPGYDGSFTRPISSVHYT